MKRVLFASTALVAFAGVASAQDEAAATDPVLLSGFAELGLFNSDAPGLSGGTDGDTEFFTDIDVTFTMSGATDGGLAFGANVDLDEGGDGTNASDNNKDDGGASIFISGAFGTLTAGDTDGALDWALTEVAFAGGSLADDETFHGGFNGNYLDGEYDGQIVRYDYTIGDFGFALSAELDDDDGEDDRGSLSTGFAIGAQYQLALGGTAIDLGLGYQTMESDGTTSLGEIGYNVVAEYGSNIDAIGVSASTTFGGAFTAGIQYTMFSFENPSVAPFEIIEGVPGVPDVQVPLGESVATGDVDHFGIGLGYSMGAIALAANYGKFEADNGSEQSGYGLIANYDLGGGAVIQAGYGSTDSDQQVDDINTFSFGVRMNF